MLYVPVGAPCNRCASEDPLFASIARMRPDGSGLEVAARGVRMSVGFDWHPETGQMWFTDNNPDWLGDDNPPGEMNILTEAGQHFGYPYCHAGDVSDPWYGRDRSCDEFEPPTQKLGPHVAAIGMTFYRGDQFPEEYRGQALVAEHGSWNRSERIGYRLTLVRNENGVATGYEDFVTGWIGDERAWGPPRTSWSCPAATSWSRTTARARSTGFGTPALIGLAAALAVAAGAALAQDRDPGEWPHYAADLSSTRYSPLEQIHAGQWKSSGAGHPGTLGRGPRHSAHAPIGYVTAGARRRHSRFRRPRGRDLPDLVLRLIGLAAALVVAASVSRIVGGTGPRPRENRPSPLRGYDVASGTCSGPAIPREGEFGNDTWENAYSRQPARLGLDERRPRTGDEPTERTVPATTAPRGPAPRPGPLGLDLPTAPTLGPWTPRSTGYVCRST